MTDRCDVAIVGSGFAGALLARVLRVIGYDVVLLERGTHPRFAIGESSTPLANLSLERIGQRYGLSDCYNLATHGRWLAHYPELRRGLKRGFTFYRHHPGEAFANRGLDSERLLVAASPEDELSDSHWLRADIDHHFVREAVRAGVDYRDRADLTSVAFDDKGAHLAGTRDGVPFALRAAFVVDASGPGGVLARQLQIASALDRTETRSALLFSHFDGVRMMSDIVNGLPAGPYPDDWAAVHHLIDEGWMYSLRFDHGTTSAGFLLTPRGLATLDPELVSQPELLWRALLDRYPTLHAVFGDAVPLMPIGFRPLIQHRLARAAGDRWVLLPHAYAFVDPLFSTGIAWSLRAVERLARLFESANSVDGVPTSHDLRRYELLLAEEADQIDRLVAGAYESLAHFDLFVSQAMLYFAAVSFAEASERLTRREGATWRGFLGIGDRVLGPLFAESRRRLRLLGDTASSASRSAYAEWSTNAIAPRNVAGLADPARHNLYAVDLDVLIERHSLLGLTRAQIERGLPALRASNGSGLPASSHG